MPIDPKKVDLLYKRNLLENLNSFLVIGAMDGVKHDDFLVKIPDNDSILSIFVEPVPFHFERLKENTKDLKGKLIFEQEIVSDRKEEVTLTYLNPQFFEIYAGWMDGCSSVIEDDQPINVPIRDVAPEHLLTITKECLTVQDILKKNGLEKIDYIQIDTEGYDERIVESLDLERLDVKILKFEVFYLKPGFSERIREKLDRLGYEYTNVGEAGENLFCIRKDFLNQIMGEPKKVSFVCTTYRRFFCVERIIAQFHAQTYPNKELIIFNTDVDFPLSLDFDDPTIIVINCNKRYSDGAEYKNRGEICWDAISHASGDYFMLADDDDIYLPWHIQQAVDGIEEGGKDAWKPEMSFFATQDKLELCMNTLEASVIVKMERIREIGFRTDLTGYEGLSWYTKLRDEGNLDERNKEYVPSYCFNWGDPSEIAGHKQSGDISNPQNFENHKISSLDYAKRPLRRGFSLAGVYPRYFEFLKNNRDLFSRRHFDLYASHMLG